MTWTPWPEKGMDLMRELYTFPRIPLGVFPTPLYRLDRLSRELGLDLYIKRDDLIGVALGGNKVRKLEFLLADARAKGADVVLTAGGAQSNHAMLTAACAARVGMEAILVLKERGVVEHKGNLILNDIFGAQVRFVDTDSYEEIYREMDRIGEELSRKVYKIPCGGSNALGSLGYVDCMKEIAQSGQHFDHIVCACGSGGTAAGTILGAKLYMPETHVMCSMVDSDPFDVIVPELMEQAAQLLGTDTELPVPDLLDMCGPGYSIPSEEGNQAIAMMMRQEGIVLDTCYTGKAFAGLIQRAKAGEYKKEDHVLFIHSGGAGGLFAQDWEKAETV